MSTTSESSNERLVRGYMIQSTLDYLRKSIGAERADAIVAQLPEAQRAMLAQPLKPAGWYPAEAVSLGCNLVVEHVGKGDPDRIRTSLIELGQCTAEEAAGTFLKLLMRVLTPSLLAKRFPQLFARDISFGKVTVTLEASKFTVRISGVEGFDHCAPVAMGFASFVLKQMGKNVEFGQIEGWSPATPGPDTASFSLLWDN